MATETTRIRNYEGGDVFQIVRLFYETVRSVNRADYSEEQVRTWAPEILDPEAWHARMADRRTLLAEGHGGVIGFGELEGDGHLDMLGRNAAEMVDAPRDLGTSHSEAEEDFRHLTDAQAKILFFTFDLYGHLIPSAQGDVVRRLNASQERAETG